MVRPRTRLLLWLSLVVLIISLYSEYIFGDDLFIFSAVGSDTHAQYWPFDRLFGDILRSGDFTQWTFRIGLGQQIFPQVAYLNPFRLLIHLMPPDFAVNMYVVKMVLEIICAVLLWRLYLSKIGVVGVPNTLFSLFYGFNGYLLLWGQHVSFGVVFSLIPLTLYALELLLKEKKSWPLVLSLALFMGISIYFFAMFVVFFALFGIARLLHTSDGFRVAGIKTIRLIFCGIIAGLLAAWIIIPEVLFYLESPRVDEPMKIGLWSHFGWMHHLSLMRVFSNNIFGTGAHYYGPLNYYEAPQLYCGLLTLLLIPQFFSYASIKERAIYGLIFIVLTLALFSPYLAHLFNARFTLNNRHTFLLIVFWIFIAAHGFYKIEQYKTFHQPVFWTSWSTLLFIVGIPLAIVCLLDKEVLSLSKGQLRSLHYFIDGSHPNLSRSEIPQLLKYELIPNIMKEGSKIAGVLIAYGLFFFLFAKKWIKSLKPLFVVILAEIILLSYPTINQRATLEAHYLTGDSGYYDGTMAAVEHIESIDHGFYRIAKTYHSVFLNDSAFQGYHGTKGYTSLTEPATIRFYNEMNINYYKDKKSSNYQGGFSQRPGLNDLVGVKYVLSKEPIHSPDLLLIKKIDAIYIYQNKNARTLGFIYHRVWDDDLFDQLATDQKDDALLMGAVVPKDILLQLKNEGIEILDAVSNVQRSRNDKMSQTAVISSTSTNVFQIISFREDHIVGRMETTRPGILFFSIPHNRGWHVKVDRTSKDIFPVNKGFLGVLAPRGAHDVELVFKPYGAKVGRYISLGTLFVLLAFFCFFKKTYFA